MAFGAMTRTSDFGTPEHQSEFHFTLRLLDSGVSSTLKWGKHLKSIVAVVATVFVLRYKELLDMGCPL